MERTTTGDGWNRGRVPMGRGFPVEFSVEEVLRVYGGPLSRRVRRLEDTQRDRENEDETHTSNILSVKGGGRGPSGPPTPTPTNGDTGVVSRVSDRLLSTDPLWQ